MEVKKNIHDYFTVAFIDWILLDTFIDCENVEGNPRTISKTEKGKAEVYKNSAL